MSDLAQGIHEKYLQVQEQISAAAVSCGRDPAGVKLVVVSKAQPLNVLEAALEAGIRVFGENYPEEACEKINRFQAIEGIEWHMIGHLQSRKARLVAELFACLHSLDSLHLAEKLNTILVPSQKTLPVLIEMNVSGEESKFGWPAWDEDQWMGIVPVIEEMLIYSQLKVSGLMTMPPFGEDPERARPYFARLRKLRDFLESKIPAVHLSELSMGTSADFQAAVKEGATLVRVGQAILGSRPSRKV